MDDRRLHRPHQSVVGVHQQVSGALGTVGAAVAEHHMETLAPLRTVLYRGFQFHRFRLFTSKETKYLRGLDCKVTKKREQNKMNDSFFMLIRFFLLSLHSEMKRDQRRIMTARLLLTLFVGMLVVVSLHIHCEVALAGEECYQCVTHQPHSGHLSTAQKTLHDCLLCQMGSVTFLAAVIVSLVSPLRPNRFKCQGYEAEYRLFNVCGCQLRAPPFLCF